MLGGLYEVPKCKEIFLPMFEVGQDFATVHTSILEEYEKGIPPMSKAL